MEEKPVNQIAVEEDARNVVMRPQKDRQAWIEAAIDVLAEQGLAGLRVEVLAKSCGVTKGSFYWHFRDRTDLLDAILTHWQTGRLRDIDKTTAAAAGEEAAKLEHVFDVYGTSRNRKGMAIELAIRDWARRDAATAAVVESVDRYRLECTHRLFMACGMSDEEARSRSVLLYACVFGLSLMHFDGYDPSPGQLRQRMRDRLLQP